MRKYLKGLRTVLRITVWETILATKLGGAVAFLSPLLLIHGTLAWLGILPTTPTLKALSTATLLIIVPTAILYPIGITLAYTAAHILWKLFPEECAKVRPRWTPRK